MDTLRDFLGREVPEGLPRVTEILVEAGLVSTDWMTEDHRDRGSAVHLACKYLNDDDLDWDSLDPEVRRRVEQYQEFLRVSSMRVELSEFLIASPTFGYVGHPDLLGLCETYQDGKPAMETWLIDIKGTSRAAWHGVQLAAYRNALALPDSPVVVVRCGNLYLGGPRYKFVMREDPIYWNTFKAALSLYNWRKTCKELA